MDAKLVAVPSEMPGGLDAALGAHFGHCDCYTLVELKDGKAGEVKVVPNMPHRQGGCMAPVNYLAGQGVNSLIAGGMGFRPLQGFQQVGIRVFYGGTCSKVGEAVDALLAEKLPEFQQQHTCGGGMA